MPLYQVFIGLQRAQFKNLWLMISLHTKTTHATCSLVIATESEDGVLAELPYCFCAIQHTHTHTHTHIYIHTHTHTYIYIQGVSRLVDITAGGDFLGLCDQKSSYKHVSDCGRLRSYGHFLIPVHAVV